MAELNAGSRWHRWEPHVHAPGTVLNNQFSGPDPWEDYLLALESATPSIRALAVTDYYSTESYEKVCDAKRRGRLPNCGLIFPNIEMRLGIGTVKGRWVNLHLLVSPESADHLVELKRFLARLTFKAHEDSFGCHKDDLIKLGQRCDSRIVDPTAALKHGSEQFKVSFDELKRVYSESNWAQQNVLVAVAGSETDGTSGIREAADTTMRQEVEKFAQIIFASSSAQREFWLGRKAIKEEEMRRIYNGLKPCLHGSDAHETSTVGVPNGDRYSWIKGALEFDTLRQACIDPSGRAFVGAAPPLSASPSQVIDTVEIKDAPWATTPRLALNPGLIAIIGARGSGKTALADIIALGADAMPTPPNPTSFLSRAHDLLHEASVSLRWQAGDDVERRLDERDSTSSDSYPRARYLSQQFVEKLCSAHEMTDELLREIERVIFESHGLSERDGAINFDEMLESRVSRFRDARDREETILADISERIGNELEKQSLVESLKKQVTEKTKVIDGYKSDRAKLALKGSEERITRLTALTSAAEKIRTYIRHFNAQEQALIGLKDEVNNVRTYQAPEALRQSKDRHKLSNLKEEEWAPFLLDYRGDVDTTLDQHLQIAQKNSASWRGSPPSPMPDNTPFIANDVDLGNLPLATLQAEIKRLEGLISVDRETTMKFSAISKRMTEENVILGRLHEKLLDCEGAPTRRNLLIKEREASYARVFDLIQSEQKILSELYQPLMSRLAKAEGSLRKLTFSVVRSADVEKWASDGESLLDLRQKGPFKGRGALEEMASATLKSAWEVADPQAVTEAMTKFRTENQTALLDSSAIAKDQSGYRAWAKSFAKWLYGTDHIAINYSINYDGVDIRKLSPGTRGIVLLLLYLALDNDDDRPLIIDQPEENLDPRSIFDELVGLFLQAKNKRQVIIVTHNANLVVNTDADQVIVAQTGPHAPGELPPITYLSGGLESAPIRKAVCDILEGGERAFQERARRLRVRLSR